MILLLGGGEEGGGGGEGRCLGVRVWGFRASGV